MTSGSHVGPVILHTIYQTCCYKTGFVVLRDENQPATIAEKQPILWHGEGRCGALDVCEGNAQLLHSFPPPRAMPQALDFFKNSGQILHYMYVGKLHPYTNHFLDKEVSIFQVCQMPDSARH